MKSKIAKLGENIKFRALFFEAAGNGVVGHYIHTGAQIGVLLEVNSGAAATPGETNSRHWCATLRCRSRRHIRSL